MSILEARDLTLRYGKTTAVDRLSVRLDGGKIYGLLGRNGSGKTSLLSVLAGFRKASGGEALLDGDPVFENRNATRRICLIRETGDSVDDDWPYNRVRDALAFAGEVRPYWDPTYAAGLTDRFELPMGKRLGQLSRGQRAALACVLGLASRAPVTLFDECYLGLDAPSRYTFYDELLKDFMEHPRTIVISTHLIEEVSRLFEEVVVIHAGRLVVQEDAEELRSRGTSVIGPAEAVDRVTSGLVVTGEKRLGPTKSAMVLGEFDGARRTAAEEAGLELGPVALQDLFVHLTEGVGGPT